MALSGSCCVADGAHAREIKQINGPIRKGPIKKLREGHNDCGAIHEVAAPKVNACEAPTVWQSFDIEFTSPVFENGKKREPARMTVYHNGVKIHDDVPIPVDNTRAGMGGDRSTPGPILLQDHGHPVQYRNIWLLK